MQFETLRDGDRFFYLENRFKDNPDLLKMIEATTMADIIARNDRHRARLSRRLPVARAHRRQRQQQHAGRHRPGTDLIIGFDGNDKLNGKGGNDDIYGDAGNDAATGGGGSDMMFGGSGRDNLNGNDGHDFLDGGDYDDIVKGGTGDDFVFGGNGKDKLYGEAGKDYLNGGADDDQLWGGGSKDTFAFGTYSGDDIVWDFKREDWLDLSQLEFDTLAEVRAAAQPRRQGHDHRPRLRQRDPAGGRELDPGGEQRHPRRRLPRLRREAVRRSGRAAPP